jgi:hypothetical protein
MRAGSLRVHATHYIVPHRLAIQVNFAECHMKSIFGMSLVAATGLGAAMFAGTPAEARTDFSISIGVPNAIQYDYGSGGYCDSYGCPDGYWDFPVWYGPVYWHGTWYRGPVYYREDFGRRQYWIAGGWHHDQWRGSRPDWWYRGHYYAGPALGYDYYRGHGFRHNRDRHWRGDNWRGRDNRNDDNGGVSFFLGGDRHDHHGNDNRDRNDRHGDWQNGSGGHDGNDRHDRSGQQGSNGNWQNDGSGRDANGRHDRGGNSGWSQQRDQRGITTTTTASPAAVYNAQTGNAAHGAKDRNNTDNTSGNDSGGRHHHHHDQNDNNDNNGH